MPAFCLYPPYLSFLNVMLRLLLCLSVIAFTYSSCAQTPKDHPAGETGVDTVFVTIPVNKSAIDSLQKKYPELKPGQLKQQGEFVDSSIKMTVPLQPKGRVSDFTGLFTSQQVASLDSMLHIYQQQTSNEIAIVTIDSAWTTRDKFDNFIMRLHNYWGVGTKVKNNGILIGICPGYKTIRISNGYGIEAKMTDGETKVIIDEVMVPLFKQNQFFEGVQKGIEAIKKQLQ
jgi:uncharacterized protein